MTVEDILKHAAHHRAAMAERRTIGLKIIVGIVGFDLLIMKLATDMTKNVASHTQLAWIVRLILIGAFVVVAGMLIQLEVRNSRDRGLYLLAEHRAEAIHGGRPLTDVRYIAESPWRAVRQSWATTWPLGGILCLTIGLCWMAGLTPK